MPDISGFHEIGDRADDFLNRSVRIDTAGLIEIDVVGPKPAQAVRDEVSYRHRAHVVSDKSAVRSAKRAELYGNEDVLAAAFNGPANEHLVVAHPVEVACIQQIDPGINRRLNRRDAFRFV